MKKALTIVFGGMAVLGCLSGCQTTSSNSPVALFNGRDLQGWQAVSANPALKLDDVWSVAEGKIQCKGVPVGFIQTEQKYLNFRLVVEYRWPAGQEPSNSGIFSRITDPSKSIPRCIETQLKHGSAGDVMGLQGMILSTNQARAFYLNHELAGEIRGIKKSQDAEAKPGEWNRVEILAQDDHYTVWMNGVKINEASGVERVAGPVGLQSEGGPVEFRRADLTPLP